jgi:hypothetical protein
MFGDILIRAEGLGKKYVIGHQTERESYVALRDVIARTARGGLPARPSISSAAAQSSLVMCPRSSGP